MSVMTLRLDLYKEVYKKACSYEWRRTVDIDYCSTLQHIEGYLRDWLCSLYEMVHVSDCVHYKQEVNTELIGMECRRIQEWRYNDFKTPNINTCQMLKYLQCIHYQIEDYEMKPDGMWKPEYDQPFKMLEDAINELKSRIINEIPEYKEAKWGSV